MATDNTLLNSGTGGDTIRDIARAGGVKTQVVQLDIGGTGSEQLVTGSMPVAIADGADVAQGTTTDAAWSSGAGTVIGLLKKIASAGGSAVSIADGSDVAEGSTTDAAVVSDINGTISGKMRGLVKIFASVWDSINGRLKVDGSGVTQPISGTVNADLRVGGAAVTTTNPVPIQPPLSGFIPVSQSGTWTTGRTWTLSSGTDSITLGALTYPVSTNNSSTAQLASGATFTGIIETIQNLQAAQIEVVCDQAYTLVINQYQDAGGTKLTSSDTFVRAAGIPYNENVSLPGNYFNLVLTNNGQSTTTTLSIDTTFGIMATGPRTVTALGNNRMAINEIGGNSVTSSSLPVQVTPQQQIDLNSNNLLQAVQQIVAELRMNNYLLQQGLNVKDDLDVLRADSYYNPYLNS